MTAYSPFDKELGKLEAADLLALMQASEGWYIEYKREVPSAADIAKSISAFANTYGGWIFYGVDEKSKAEPVAGSFPGVARTDVDGHLQRMRQAIAEHINPSLHFDTRTIWGPSEPIGLTSDRAIICVQVPWSPNTPHVHKSGRIYRRVADGSEPKAEHDRFILDQLWKRADRTRKEYRRWVKRKPEFSKGEKTIPFVHLLLVADLWGDRGAWANMSLEDFRSVLERATGVVGTIPFDTFYTSNTGFVARQLEGNDPFNLTITWRMHGDLASEVLIPLNLFIADDLDKLVYELDGYEEIERFVELLRKQGHESAHIVDLTYLFNALIGITELQHQLLTKAGWTHSYFGKAKLLNVWRTIPFLDLHSVLNQFEQHGVPMCLNGIVTTPGGTDPETFIEVRQLIQLEPDGPILKEWERIVVQSLRMFAPIARAFGVPDWVESKSDQTQPYYQELQTAGRRAMEVQRRRNLRRQR